MPVSSFPSIRRLAILLTSGLLAVAGCREPSSHQIEAVPAHSSEKTSQEHAAGANPENVTPPISADQLTDCTRGIPEPWLLGDQTEASEQGSELVEKMTIAKNSMLVIRQSGCTHATTEFDWRLPPELLTEATNSETVWALLDQQLRLLPIRKDYQSLVNNLAAAATRLGAARAALGETHTISEMESVNLQRNGDRLLLQYDVAI